MKACQIRRKIKDLREKAANNQNEVYSRESAQLIYLLIQSDSSLSRSEKEERTNELRKAIRPLCKTDYESENGVCEISSLLRELCLACSFYLLEKEKRVRLFEADEILFVRICRRSFENRFFGIVSRLLSDNDEITVEIRKGSLFCCVIISAETIEPDLSENTFAVYEHGSVSLALKMKMSGTVPDRIQGEDFSLLLSDAFSPLQIWLCDI